MTERSVEATGETDLFPYLDRLFEHHIWAGKIRYRGTGFFGGLKTQRAPFIRGT